MSAPRSHPVPRRHVVPGLVVFAAFIGLSLAGQARLSARQPPETFGSDLDSEFGDEAAGYDLEREFDPRSASAAAGSDAEEDEEAFEIVAEAGDLDEPPPPAPTQKAPTPVPTPAEPPPEAPAASPADSVLAGLEEALTGLERAGRDPGNVMVAVQKARTRLQQVEVELKALRGSGLPGLDEAGRAHGRLMRASFEYDSAAREALRGAPSAMADPFSAPERLVDESRARVAAARQAMAAQP